MKLLVLLDYYSPGFRAGGPPRTLANMVERLGDRIEFWIFTRNHDFSDLTPYAEVQTNQWNTVGRARVYYCSPEALSLARIRGLIREIAPDAIYLNSFFSMLTSRCLLLRRLGLLPRIPIIIAPRGEFSPKALQLKRLKKSIYRTAVRATQLYRGVVWQASSALEKEDIVRAMGARCTIHVAANIPTQLASLRETGARVPKVPGQASFVFLSRISPKKNLPFALETLQQVIGDVTFDIYGPKETELHWGRCESLIKQLPPNVKANYLGTLQPPEVVDALAGYHFFLFPTLGENFGHVIFEALNGGCPVLVSDQTPWRDLAAKGAGWDLPLDDAMAWKNALQQCVDMDEATYLLHSKAATELARSVSANHETEEQNLALFSRPEFVPTGR